MLSKEHKLLKANIIKLIFNKHPTWMRVFLAWSENDCDLDLSKLETSFLKLIKYKQLLHDEINIEFAQGLIQYKKDNQCHKWEYNTEGDGYIIRVDDRSLDEIFADKIQVVLHLKQKQNFITSLKTDTYKHLFNSEVDGVIDSILDNKVNIKTLKTQFFNKLARYKDSSQLQLALEKFKTKNIGWSKRACLFKIAEQKLNVTLMDVKDDNTLMIEVDDHQACSALGSQAWCIVEEESYFKDYTQGMDRQFIYCDFNRTIEDHKSLIGFTVGWNGLITSSYLKDDTITPQETIELFEFKELNNHTIKNYLDKLDINDAFVEICRFGFNDFLEEYINHPDFDPIYDEQNAFEISCSNGHTDIVVRLLKIPEIKPCYARNSALREADFYEHHDIIDLILADDRVDPATLQHMKIMSAIKCNHIGPLRDWISKPNTDLTFKNNWALRYACEAGLVEILEMILKHPSIDPTWDDNHALKLTTKFVRFNVTNVLLANEEVTKHLTIDWINNNVEGECKDLCLYSMTKK